MSVSAFTYWMICFLETVSHIGCKLICLKRVVGTVYKGELLKSVSKRLHIMNVKLFVETLLGYGLKRERYVSKRFHILDVKLVFRNYCSDIV